MVEKDLNIDQIARNSLLSRDVVLEHMGLGNIIIDPFKPENLGTVSYDVTLGPWYYRQQDLGPCRTIFNPWSREDVRDIWGRAQRASRTVEYFMNINMPVPTGMNPESEIIVVGPGETILCHTKEFIGGRNIVTTMMKARSSLGRSFIEICKCAGWGDVGFINRWTMEITNNSFRLAIPLPVGARVAQIAFFQVDPFKGEDYSQAGKYQNGIDLEEIKKSWLPERMLPQLWKDKEVNL